MVCSGLVREYGAFCQVCEPFIMEEEEEVPERQAYYKCITVPFVPSDNLGGTVYMTITRRDGVCRNRMH